MTTTTQQTAAISIGSSKKLIATFALLGGLGIVFLTGFASSDTVHNAAHDTRHSMAFPCH
ncbi:CbtB domain-containing protein [Nisaea sediminum]|uniref:CbtB domain-containing protein n=1 Tax=Nisaea sediminum TaxID=2775867 RepID=UPI0018696960|nr:CbtB domain-containing protein [Nisaea sediminum]